jgi:putative ATP-binding cassette transporter
MFYYSSSWSVLSQVFPTLVVAPRYIAGLLTLGGLMQSAQAFQQAVGALSWAIDNLGKVADWRASAERVFGLNSAIEQFDALVSAASGTRVNVVVADQRVLTFRDVVSKNQQGVAQTQPINIEIRDGDRVLLTGEIGTASNLLKAVAGLWPWGDGTIELPDGAKRMFMPPRPYLPAGTLRDAIYYPAEDWETPHDDAKIAETLNRVGLEELAARLDETANWDQALSVEDQQRIGFARLLLKRPDWIFMEESTETLDPAGQKEMIDVLRQDFGKATIVAIGHGNALHDFETRRLILERDGGLVVLHEGDAATSMGA